MSAPGARGVVCAYSVNSALNSFLFMVYASASDVAAERFHVKAEQIALLYSVSLYLATATGLFWMVMIRRLPGTAQAVAVSSNASAIALMYAASAAESFPLAIASAAVMGFGAGVMLPSPAFLGDVWFGPADRSKAVSIMVEANVTGWWIGSILIPLVITEPENFQPVALTLALPVTVVVALFATFWKRLPQSESAGAARQTTPRRRDIPSMLMALLAFTLLGGVGFAIPGVQDTLLSRSTKEGGYGIPEVYTSFTNACFMLSGVICGVLLGKLPAWRPRLPVLRLLAGVSVLGLVGLVALRAADWPNAAQVPMAAVLMAVVGGPTLGYFPVAIDMMSVYGCSAEMSGGAVMLMTNLGGAVLAQQASAAYGFELAIIVAGLGVVVLALVRLPARGEPSPEQSLRSPLVDPPRPAG